MTFNGPVVSGTNNVVGANQRKQSLQRDLPQLFDGLGLGGSSLTLAG